MNPSDLQAVQAYPHLRRLLVIQLDMQFADLHGLLRLPLKKAGISAGCNLTAAALLFNIISGSSVLFYRSSMKALKDQSGRGPRFKELLAGFYPFEPDDIPRHDAPTVLYEAARNPLAHALAIQVGKRHARVTYMKDGLPVARVRELATARQRPAWTGPTVRVENGSCLISVWALAWGVHEMLRRLFEDETQVKRADATAARLLAAAPP
jgi:hypothetical protein